MVQQHPITCLDGLTNAEYQPGDEWTQTRIFDNGPTTGMEGQFRSVISRKRRFSEKFDGSSKKIFSEKIDPSRKELRKKRLLDSMR